MLNFLSRLIIILLFSLAACANPERMTAQPNPVMQKEPQMLSQILSITGVQISPLAGVTAEQGAPIVAAVIEALRDYDIPAVSGQPLAGAHILKGKASLAGGALELEWTLTDSRDVEVMAFPEREAALNAQAVQALAGRTAAAIAPLLSTAGNAGENVPPVVVGAITGAPGDGASVLAVALRRSLAGAGVTVLEHAAPNAVQVRGMVQLSDINPAAQRITLIWRVLGPDGGEVGVIDQSNEISPGRVDVNWGEVAFLAADGARDGILDLLNAYRERGLKPDMHSN